VAAWLIRWDTAIEMVFHQITCDEGEAERAAMAKLLEQAASVPQRQALLSSMAYSITMQSIKEGQGEVLLGPRHGHMILVIHVEGDAELMFRHPRDDEEVAFPLQPGDAFCISDSYR
jgi:hypothetical protein